MAILDAGLGLGAIGLRHSGSMAEVRRILEAYEPPPPLEPGATPTADMTRAGVARAMLDTIEKADEHTESVMKMGREFCVAPAASLPEGHALRFDSAEKVPDALARTAALSMDLDAHDAHVQSFMLQLLPLAARASGEDFYHPREVVRAWFGQWTPQDTLERLKRFDQGPKQQGVRAEPKPGRNDPCPCGSGKKWKKCHGGPAATA